MIRSTKAMRGFQIHASDGDLGKIGDFYFDDESWTIRYLVVETGNWLTGRTVLLSPLSVQNVDWEGEHINVSLTRQQVKDSPDIDTAMPVSRLMEMEFNRYYGWPHYWMGGGLWGPWLAPNPVAGYAPPPPLSPSEAARYERENHLRSVEAVIGHTVQARDGDVGRVEDLLVQDFNWSIQGLLVDTTPWWPGGEVTVRPDLVEHVSWQDNRVTIAVERAQLRDNPPPGDTSRPVRPA